jgi:hypothetical protein
MAEAAERAAPARHLTEQAEQHIGEHREARHQVELLKHDADPDAQVTGRLGDAATRLHGHAEDADLAGAAIVDRREARNGTDQGGLAGAGGADQRHHLAGLHLEIDVPENGRAAHEGFTDLCDRNRWTGHAEISYGMAVRPSRRTA